MQTAIVKSDGSTLRIDNGLGARGMDWTSVTTSSGTTTSFPIYDAHGNEVATLSRGSSNTYSLANHRSYGAWGEIRQGSATGGPRGRYCGELGHIQDDESGLVYMRARYYEPTSGRFVSEDPGGHGGNWFVYCNGNPVSGVDASGCDTGDFSKWIRYSFMFAALGVTLCGFGLAKMGSAGGIAIGFLKKLNGLVSLCALGSVLCAIGAFFNSSFSLKAIVGFFAMDFAMVIGLAGMLTEAYTSYGQLSENAGIVGAVAGAVCAAHLALIAGALFWAIEGE